MARLPRIVEYGQAKRFLEERNRLKVKLGYATWLQQEDGCYQIIHHRTPIVTYYPDHMVLDNGGWYSRTTLERLNAFAPVYVFQRNWDWYVEAANGIFHFEPGLVVNYRGEVLNGKPAMLGRRKK